ncbi:MAG: kelch repeat-containing protein [Planctomycetota bacterium]
MVVFGGFGSPWWLNEVWEWDGVIWRNRTTPTIPLGAYSGDAVFDRIRGKTVLFFDGQTWEWDGIDWSLRSSTGPTHRIYSSMAYDSSRGICVLFGGYVPNNLPFGLTNETWEWNGYSWAKCNPIHRPPARQSAGMAYDELRHRMVMYGGDNNMANGGFNDTWEWDGIDWYYAQAQNGPPRLYHHAMAYDANRHVTVMTGDATISGLWEWDGQAWNSRQSTMTPSAQYGATLVYDSAREVVALFGGWTPDGASRETWEWNGANWNNASDDAPYSFSQQLCGFDTRRSLSVFMGLTPFDSDFMTYLTPFEWDGIKWQKRTDAIGPEYSLGGAMCYDVTRGLFVLFGGIDSHTEIIQETFEYDGQHWNVLSAIQGPPGRTDGCMAFDSQRQVSVLFGGIGESGSFLSDTWEWDGQVWVKRYSTDRPPSRAYHTMAYDSTRGVCVLFGGSDAGSLLGDTWEWDGVDWNQRIPASNPAARRFHSMVYDSARGFTTLFGGEGYAYFYSTWLWDGNNWINWTVEHPDIHPPARAYHAMTFDCTRQQNVVVGGSGDPLYGNVQYIDTWEFGAPKPPEVVKQPASPSVCENSLISLRTKVIAESGGSLTFQWQKDETNLIDDENHLGSTSPTITITHVSDLDAGSYRCIVHDGCSEAMTNPSTMTVYASGTMDGNLDGQTDARDIAVFIDALTNFAPVSAPLCAFDLTGEGIVSIADIPPFVAHLLGE